MFAWGTRRRVLATAERGVSLPVRLDGIVCAAVSPSWWSLAVEPPLDERSQTDDEHDGRVEEDSAQREPAHEPDGRKQHDAQPAEHAATEPPVFLRRFRLGCSRVVRTGRPL